MLYNGGTQTYTTIKLIKIEKYKDYKSITIIWSSVRSIYFKTSSFLKAVESAQMTMLQSMGFIEVWHWSGEVVGANGLSRKEELLGKKISTCFF